jgi:hypothetical protein
VIVETRNTAFLILLQKKNSEYFEVVEWDSLYAFNLRIKALLTSYVRNKTASLVLLDYRSVVRIQTDNVCFTRSLDISAYDDLKAEDKTTGKIYFRNCNDYIKVEKGQKYEIGDKTDKYNQ